MIGSDSKLEIIIKARDEASQVFKKVSSQFETTRKKINSVGKDMTMKVTAPLVAGGIAAIKLSSEFDTVTRAAAQMNKGSGKSLDEMKKDIRKLSIATVQDTKKMMKAYYDTGSAGYKGAEGLKILEVAGKAATGGLADVDVVTNTLVKTLSMFNKKGDDAEDVMDKLNGIVDTGIITFSQLANTFPIAAAQSDALGISVEETGAALAVMTKKSGSAEEAATSINAVFTSLVKPSEALKEAIKSWGYENSQAAIKALGFTGVLSKLNEELDGDVEAMGEMFNNVKAIKAIMPLLNNDTKEYTETLKTINESQGRTNELFDDMVKGPGAKMKQSWIRLKIALAEFGDVMTPIMIEFIDKLEILFEKFEKLNPEQQKAIIIAAGLAAALGPVLIVLGSVATAVTVLLSPVGLIIIAVGVLIGLVYNAYKNFGSFKDSLVVIGNYIENTFNKIIEGLVSKIQGLINKVREALSKLAEMAKKASIGGVGAGFGGLIQKGLDIGGIPHLADGGIVRKPTLAVIGEAGSEAVVPLNKQSGFGGGTTINITINGDVSGEELIEKVKDSLWTELKMNGQVAS